MGPAGMLSKVAAQSAARRTTTATRTQERVKPEDAFISSASDSLFSVRLLNYAKCSKSSENAPTHTCVGPNLLKKYRSTLCPSTVGRYVQRLFITAAEGHGDRYYRADPTTSYLR
jgi:hypothetical protein